MTDSPNVPGSRRGRRRPDEFNTSMVRLTADGQQYLDTYGKNGADT